MSRRKQKEMSYSKDQLELIKQVPPAMASNNHLNPCNVETMIQADLLKRIVTKVSPASNLHPLPLSEKNTSQCWPTSKFSSISQFHSNLSRSNNGARQFRGFLQIMKIVAPLPSLGNEMFTLFLSDGHLGMVCKLSMNFSYQENM